MAAGGEQEVPRNPDGTFPKGVSGNPKGNPDGGQANSLPPMLRDLRWAYAHKDDDKKGTARQEEFRQMYKDERKEFLSLFRAMEREHKPAAKKKEQKPADTSVPPPLVEKDVGSEEALGLIDRWLKEWQGAQPPPG